MTDDERKRSLQAYLEKCERLSEKAEKTHQ